MDRLSRVELARRAGVDLAYATELIELGVIAPDQDGLHGPADVRRVRMVEMLDHAGLPLAGIGAALQGGVLSLEFVETATYDRFASYSEYTFEELSRRTGVPIELLAVVREATGAAQPQPEDRLRDDELRVVPLIELQLAHGFRPAVIERALRVYGESLRRMAETEADWWQSEVVLPTLRSGGGWADIGTLAAELSPRLSETSDAAVLAVYHGQQTHAWMRNILEGVERALDAAGLRPRRDGVPPAICFFDLTGYTSLTEERGDEAAAAAAAQLAHTVGRIAAQHGGKTIKFLGDGVMLYFPDPARAILAALEMLEATAHAGLPRGHVGLHAGPVLFQEGDYFGRTVNLASRIADYARPGEVLASQEAIQTLDDQGVVLTDIGEVSLKGVGGPTRLFAVRRATEGSGSGRS